MYTPSRPPAWHRDAIWVAGVVLAAATLVAGAAFAWSRLAGQELARPILVEALRATLLPGAEGDAATLAVRPRTTFAPGEPFEALPGAGVRIDPTELEGFDAQDAVDRIAGVWTSLLLGDGREGLLGSVEEPELRAQLETVVAGPADRLVEAELAEELLGAGLDDGSRLADWPAQAQQDPGDPVQPIVGLFLFFEPGELQGLSDRQIGEAAVAALADLLVEEGADAAREAIGNVNLEARFEQALAQSREAVHELFAALLRGRRDALGARLDEARAVLTGGDEAPEGLEGLLPASELAGLPEEETNERILGALADRAWAEGPDALRPLLEGDVRAERLDAAVGTIGAFTRAARAEAMRVLWAAAVVGVLAFAVVAGLARGVGRIARPGAALAAGALPGALLAWWATGRAEAAVPLPAGARAEGVFAELGGLAGYLLAAVPAEAIVVVLRAHAVLAGVGAGLVLTALILLAASGLRPRRRGYL